MSFIHDPARRAFIQSHFVDQPLDKAGVNYWWSIFEDQKARIERGDHAILDANWIAGIERRLAKGDFSVDELAGSIRHQYTMALYDAEHREPRGTND